MRSRGTAALCSALAFLVVSATAGAAEPVEEQLKRMEERLLQMEDRLQATSEQLEAAETQVEAQNEVLHSAGLADGRAEANGLTDFVNSINFGGWVAGSWTWNFNNPDGQALNGANQGSVTAYPFHPDANSFALDQFWLEMERPIDEENRSGFRVDLNYGKSAGLLGDAPGTVGNGGDGFSGNDFNLYQAYIQYLAPIGNGVSLQFGKFGTVIGVEVMQQPYNFNISRGHLYQLFQPFTHTGILASTEVGGFSLALGGVNSTRSFDAADVDLGNGKAALWSIGYEIGNVGLSFAGAWGSADGSRSLCSVGVPGSCKSGADELILDWIVSWDPMENLSTYVNVDYITTDDVTLDLTNGRQKDVDGVGVAAAARYGITDRTGFAFRGEWARLNNFYGTATSPEDLKIWGLTGTVDHLLTDALMLKTEVRYDNGDDGMGNNVFQGDDGFVLENKSQVVLLVEAIYKFDGFGGE